MKKVLFNLLLIPALMSAQCNVNVNAMCSKACVPGTLYINQVYCGWFAILATGATSYTWSVSGPDGSYTHNGDTAKFYPQLPGFTTYSVIGTCSNSATGSAQVTVEAEICPYGSPNTVGINEYSTMPNGTQPIYYDLQGNQVAKQPNTLLIEQRGLIRRKIYYRE